MKKRQSDKFDRMKMAEAKQRRAEYNKRSQEKKSQCTRSVVRFSQEAIHRKSER